MSTTSSRRSKRKSQTRLRFDPVDPSSSATFSPARVRFDDSHFTSSASSPRPNYSGSRPSRRNGILPFKALSSPIRSSATQVSSRKDELDPLDSEPDQDILPPAKRLRLEHASPSHLFKGAKTQNRQNDPPSSSTSFMARPRSTRKQRHTYSASDTFSDEGSEVRSSKTKGSKRQRTAVSDTVDTEEDEVNMRSQSSPTRTRARGEAAGVSKAKISDTRRERGASYSSSVSDDGSRPITSSGRKVTTIRISDDSNDDEEDDIVLPTPRRTQNMAAETRGRDERDAGATGSAKVSRQQITSIPSDTSISSSDPTDDAELPGLQQIEPARSKKSKTASNSQSADGSEIDEDDAEGDILAVSSPRRRRSRVENALQDLEDSEEVTRSSPAKRSRRLRRAASSQAQSTSETEVRQTVRRLPPKRPHRTDKQKALELMRRKRNGESITELTPSGSDNDAGGPHGLYDSDSDLEVLSQFDDEDPDEHIEQIRESLRPDKREGYDEDFVIEDDDENLGVPLDALHSIPLQFTHHAHKKLAEHFKDAVEWMVQKKLNPGGFDMHDPVYVQAFRKVDDEVAGLASSKFTSSVWREGFTKALWARPEMHEAEITGDVLHEGRCDACGRSGHPAKFEVSFQGKAYSKDTLEEIDKHDEEDDDEASDENEDEDNDVASINSKGQAIPPTTKTWFVGRFCKANAEMAHTLIHWKYQLNTWVADTLQREGQLGPGRAVERDKWSSRKRSKYANRVVDEWERGRQIKELFRDFKAALENARNSKPGRWRT